MNKFFKAFIKKMRCQLGFAALSPTVVKKTEFAGDVKLKVFTVTPGAASDTVDLSSYFDTIIGVIPVLQGGADAALLAGVQASFSGTTVTLVTQAENGTAATDWTGATIRLMVFGTDKGTAA